MPLDAGQLYTDYAPMLRGYIARRVCADDVEDVLHDVFVRVLRSRYEDRGVAGGWLCRIAASVIIDRRRADRARAQTVPLNERTVAIVGPEDTTEQALTQAWVREQIRAHLAGQQFRVIWLRFVEDQTRDEVAAQLGMTIGAVAAVQFRATVKLRRAMVGDKENQ